MPESWGLLYCKVIIRQGGFGMISQELLQATMQARMMDVARIRDEKIALALQKQDASDRSAPVDVKRRGRIPAFLANVLRPATTS